MNINERGVKVTPRQLLQYHVYFLVYYFYRPQRSCGKIMFLDLSLILFTGGSGRPPWADTPLPGRPPWADTPGQTPLGRHPLGRHPVEADTPQGSRHPPREQTPPRSACWEIRATSGRYASYWNAYLFCNCTLFLGGCPLIIVGMFGAKA